MKVILHIYNNVFYLLVIALMWPTATFTCLLSVCSGWEFSLTLLSSCTMSGILNKIWKLYLNWSKLTIVLLLQQKNSRGVVMHWHIPLTHTHTDTNRAHKRTWILQSLAVFPALMDPITLSKTAQTEPYGEPIAMVIQLFLMDTLPIINLWGGGGGGIFQTNCCSRGKRTLC